MSEFEITSGDIEAAAKEAATPEAASPAVEPTPVEKTPPAIPASPVVDEHGPIPFERHEAILGKTRREYDDKISQLSWAQGLTREEVERALALDRIYRTNPERLAAHLSERVKPNAEPQPDTKDEHGQLFYSPQQAAKWADWKADQKVAALRAEMDERYGPIASSFTEHQQLVDANAQIDEARNLPGFGDHVADIAAQVTAARQRGERITLFEAYVRAGVPQKLAALTETQKAELKKQWAKDLSDTTERVQDDVNPSRVPAASRTADANKPTKKLLEEEYNRRATA